MYIFLLFNGTFTIDFIVKWLCRNIFIVLLVLFFICFRRIFLEAIDVHFILVNNGSDNMVSVTYQKTIIVINYYVSASL